MKLSRCFLILAMTVVPLQLWAQGMKPLSLEVMLARDQADNGGQRPREEPFPPHKIVGNIYFVGESVHAAFLITTPQGHILINSNRERNVPWLRESVEKIGFKFTDIKVILGSHAHVDHMEGDALVKQLTGAQVIAMDRDVAALQEMRPGGKPHPIDRVLKDREQVTFNGQTLTAYLTAGHTKGCTSWTTKAAENGRTYDVVIIGCIGANGRIVLVNNKDYPEIAGDFQRSYDLLRTLPADVFMGSHNDHYNGVEKYNAIGKGPNPFIDPQGYKNAINNYEQVFKHKLAQQQKQ
jgi:metallo-beta-lactamase class B